MRPKTLIVLASFCLLSAAHPLWGQEPEAPLRYQLDLREPATHLVRVTMQIPGWTRGGEIQFPAWNNLYQIRDFVRDVQDLTAACDGKPASLSRVDLETWSYSNPCSELTLHYEVYANQPGPFSAELDLHHAFLNFALLLFYLPKDRARPIRVRLLLPQGWKLATLLDAGPEPGEFQAVNYDRLADSPAEAGQFSEYDYKQRGASYRVIVDADPEDYSAPKLLKALKRITATETALMREVPFKRYTFIFDFPHSGVAGGMEHADGTAIYIPADRTRSSLAAVEAVAAHEFFHLWNVKRIRPQALEPIDYVHGNDTRDLWFSEGVTSTYGELTLLRSELISRREFFDHLASEIQQLRSRPARFYQSVVAAGRDAWLEKYPDYFRPERSISYYNKGELLGDLLDLGIRHATGNRESLDDLMRRLNRDFAEKGRFFTESDLRVIVHRLAPGFPAEEFFRNDVDGTKPLDFAGYLAYAGLELRTNQVQAPDLGFHSLMSFGGRVRVESVDPASASARAGLQPGDVLIKMNGTYLTVLPDEQLAGMKPGDEVVFSVERNGRDYEVTFPLGAKSAVRYEVDEMKQMSSAQHSILRGWLEGKTESAAGAAN
jgi:predicted metalloprotease with PDZ domain